MSKELRYAIYGPIDPETNLFLYWSNEIGWVTIEDAETFGPIELDDITFPMEAAGYALLTEDEKNIQAAYDLTGKETTHA